MGYGNWQSVKEFTFPDEAGVLGIEGAESSNNVNGCTHSGLSLTCTSDKPKSPWKGFKSTPKTMKATGSSSASSTPSGFGTKVVGSKPCSSSSPYHLAGFNTAHSSAGKIWAANGKKYAWFSADPYAKAEESEACKMKNNGNV